jgi:hypothetical protein
MVRALPVLMYAAVLGSCAATMPPVPMHRFSAGDIEGVRAFFDAEVREGHEANLALALNGLAQTELLLGRTEHAWRHFQTAGRIMGNWQTAGSETFAAVVGSEGSKTWKGDPYERAMNAFYTGLLYLWRGEPDNARAAFKKGILADGESSDEKFQADFTLLFWLAGRMSLLMGSASDAEDFFAEARTANSFSVGHGSRGSEPNPVLREPARGNLVCLVEVGLGPEKYPAGDQGELARFRPRWHPAQTARIVLDGRELGLTTVLVDVDYQARTRGGTEMEGIRQGKAVFKTVTGVAGVVMLGHGAHDRGAGKRDALIAGGGLLLLSLLTSAEADVRHWPTLPSTVQCLTADVPPGSHTLRIEFLDGRGAELPDLSQEWAVEVPEVGESYYLFRSLPGLDRIQRSP